jgi:hypothetical protein
MSKMKPQSIGILVRTYDRQNEMVRAAKRGCKRYKFNNERTIVGYTDTHVAEMPKGCSAVLYLWTKFLDPEMLTHEAVHVASAILARRRLRGLLFTTGTASAIEEDFAELVGTIAAGLRDSVKGMRRLKIKFL